MATATWVDLTSKASSSDVRLTLQRLLDDLAGKFIKRSVALGGGQFPQFLEVRRIRIPMLDTYTP